MDEIVSVIFSNTETQKWPSGSFLFHAQDTVEFIHFIEEGKVSLERIQANGQISCFLRAKAGDVLAEASVYSQQYHCDARVLEDVRLRRVKKEKFMSQLKSDPNLADAWSTYLARTVHRTRLIAEIRSFKTVGDRLDAWLDAFQDLPPKGQWQSLAHELAVTPEALYRALAKRRG